MSGLRLPAALTSIEAEAFCSGSFQYVIVPPTCTSIGARAFADCGKLLYILIPASVTGIDTTAFDGCGAGLVIERLPG